MQTKTLTITDPRTFDGDPFQVAERAAKQLQALAEELEAAVEAAELMARNAELERSLITDRNADLRPVATGWPESPQGRKFASIRDSARDARKAARTLVVAVSYNPKGRMGRPPKG